jgi:hypothetical protein
VNISWQQFLAFFGFAEHSMRMQKTSPVKKVRLSKETQNTSRDTIELQEGFSPFSKKTRSSKRKLTFL